MKKLAILALKHIDKLLISGGVIYGYNKISNSSFFNDPFFTKDGKEVYPIQILFNFLIFFSLPFVIFVIIFKYFKK